MGQYTLWTQTDSWSNIVFYCGRGRGYVVKIRGLTRIQNFGIHTPLIRNRRATFVDGLLDAVSNELIIYTEKLHRCVFVCWWVYFCRFSQSLLAAFLRNKLCTYIPKVYSALRPSVVGKWVPVIAGKAKAGMAHSDCGWTCGCPGKTVKSIENTYHTWALLRWWFTTKRRSIKCTHLYLYLYLTHITMKN